MQAGKNALLCELFNVTAEGRRHSSNTTWRIKCICSVSAVKILNALQHHGSYIIFLGYCDLDALGWACGQDERDKKCTQNVDAGTT